MSVTRPHRTRCRGTRSQNESSRSRCHSGRACQAPSRRFRATRRASISALNSHLREAAWASPAVEACTPPHEALPVCKFELQARVVSQPQRELSEVVVEVVRERTVEVVRHPAHGLDSQPRAVPHQSSYARTSSKPRRFSTRESCPQRVTVPNSSSAPSTTNPKAGKYVTAGRIFRGMVPKVELSSPLGVEHDPASTTMIDDDAIVVVSTVETHNYWVLPCGSDHREQRLTSQRRHVVGLNPSCDQIGRCGCGEPFGFAYPAAHAQSS